MCVGERVAPALPDTQPRSRFRPAPGRGCGRDCGRGRGWALRKRPLRGAWGARKPGEGHGPAQGHTTAWDPLARGGRLFPCPALLTSRRLRSAGCSRMERLSRYCHSGLSSGGSRRFSRRDRHGGHRLPAGEGVMGQSRGLQAPGVSLSLGQPRGFSGSAPVPTLPAGTLRRVPQVRPYSPRKRPVAKAAPRAAEPRASAAGTESRGMGWVMAQARSGGGRVPCAGVTETAPGPAGLPGSALSGHCPRSHGLECHLAAAFSYCKPRSSEPNAIWWSCSKLRPVGSKHLGWGFFGACGLEAWVREETFDALPGYASFFLLPFLLRSPGAPGVGVTE